MKINTNEVIKLSPEDSDLLISCCESEKLVKIQGKIYEYVTHDDFNNVYGFEGTYYIFKRLSDGVYFELISYMTSVGLKVIEYMEIVSKETTKKFIN